MDLAGEAFALARDAGVAVHRREFVLHRLELGEQAAAFLAGLLDAGDPEAERQAEGDRERRDAEASSTFSKPDQAKYPTETPAATTTLPMIARRMLVAATQTIG